MPQELFDIDEPATQLIARELYLLRGIIYEQQSQVSTEIKPAFDVSEQHHTKLCVAV